MRISDDAVSSFKPKPDYNKIFFELAQKYRNIFTYHFEDKVFIYRALGRKEYRDIILNKELNDFEKEEVLCEQCMLYPNDVNFDDYPAGVPSMLVEEILKHSYLDSMKSRAELHAFYRSEMFNMDNQISCIISEAFPQINIEDIEQWDIERTTKYLSRAEWKLTNFHGLHMKEDLTELYGLNSEGTPSEEYEEEVEEKPEEKRTIRGGKKSDKLTPEKIKDREEFLRKFPEFRGLHDDGMDGISGIQQSDVDDRPPALRPGWG